MTTRGGRNDRTLPQCLGLQVEPIVALEKLCGRVRRGWGLSRSMMSIHGREEGGGGDRVLQE